MAAVSDAMMVTINYQGGSITLPVGNAKDLFGTDGVVLLRPEGEQVTVSKKAHSRVRVIGGPTTQVASSIYTYTKWPRRRRSNSAGGVEILMAWEESEGSWTARMTGSASDLGTFLNDNSPKAVVFSTDGSEYGPFMKKEVA